MPTASKRLLKPFTVDHFALYASKVVWDDDEHRELENWQLEIVGDLFAGYKRNLWIIPEENGKSTLVALLALYSADYTSEPWIPGLRGGREAGPDHPRPSRGLHSPDPGDGDSLQAPGRVPANQVAGERRQRGLRSSPTTETAQTG